MDSLFREYGYDQIRLDTNLNNLRAQHVYEQLGFVKVRVNRDSWTDQLGALQSSVDYECSREQWNSFLK
jgi:RimJ/RimL family protein N-acetyltransferase